MVRQWKALLLAHAAEWNLPEAGDWHFLLHNNYQPQQSSFNVLWFYEREQSPRVVAKVSQQVDILTSEFHHLETIYRLVGHTAPRPLYIGCIEDLWTLWMTGVRGLRIRSQPTYPRSELITIVDKVVEIHRAVKIGCEQASPDRHARMVAKPLEALSQFGDSATVRAGCAALAEACPAVWVDGLPLIPQHGDLFLDNIHRYREELYVVDWETFGSVDLPFYDLLTVLLSVLRALHERPEQFNPKLAAQMPGLIERYARGLELPVSLATKLLPLTLANWFYLHWIEGRQVMMGKLYGIIQDYFERSDLWAGVFNLGQTSWTTHLGSRLPDREREQGVYL